MKSPFREKLLAGPHLPWGWKAISSPEKAANAWVQGNPSRLCDWDGWKLLLFPRSGLNTSFLWDGTWILSATVWVAGCVGIIYCLCGPLFFPSRQQITLWCRLPPPYGWKTHLWQCLAVSCAAAWFSFWFDTWCDLLISSGWFRFEPWSHVLP